VTVYTYNMMLLIARSIKAIVETMERGELRTWYLAHVGYDPVDEEPETTDLHLRCMVAGSMFYDHMPSGVDERCRDRPDVGAESVESLMCKAIKGGTAL
jgi:hypothetical protein